VKTRLILFLLLLAPASAAAALLVGTSEPDLAFVRATAFKPFHARFDVPFDEKESLTSADLAGRKVILLVRGATVADGAALHSWVGRGGRCSRSASFLRQTPPQSISDPIRPRCPAISGS